MWYNRIMVKHKGFTLIEVSIFLAITGLLLGTILVSTSNSIGQQRFTDAVQSFADFLRGVYNTVENPQNVISDAGGRSDKALYGRLVTFGESYDFDGKEAGNRQLILSYDVIGNVDGRLDGNDILQTLKGREIDVISKNDDGSPIVNGTQESYAPKWGNRIQDITKNGDGNWNDFKGALLVVRSPKSGAIHTFVTREVIDINAKIAEWKGPDEIEIHVLSDNSILDTFKKIEVDFCVGSNDFFTYNGARQDIRLNPNAHNSSDIKIIPLDSDDNKCEV